MPLVSKKRPAFEKRSRPAKADLVELIDKAAEAAAIEGQKAFESKMAVLRYPDSEERSESSHLKNVLSPNQSKLPSLAYLLTLYLATHGQGDPAKVLRATKEQQQWLVYWLAAKLEDLTEKKKLPLPLDYRKQWINAVNDLKEEYKTTTLQAVSGESYLPTLQSFPTGFLPLVVITGASQAHPPRRREDLFRDNARFSDLTYLLRFDFGSKPLLLSDSAIITMQNDDERAELLGDKNLLIIGGPSVNIVTRQYWKKSLFNFQYDARRKYLDNLFDEILQPVSLFRSEGHVSLFYDYMKETVKFDIHEARFRDRGPTKAERERLHEIVQRLRREIKSNKADYERVGRIYKPKGFLDPVRLDQGEPPSEKDYALITVAPNLWERPKKTKAQRIAVIVAGFSELGTSLGLKALSNASSGFFESHPLGGLLEVSQGGYRTRAEAFAEVGYYQWNPRALTPGYTVPELQESIKEQASLLANERSLIFEEFTEADLAAYASFLERFHS